MSAVDGALNAGDKAKQQANAGRGWYAALARTGLVARGLSFGLVGVLAAKLAFGDGGAATSRQGALAQLSHHSFGKAALIALALGFTAYALWRFVEALVERGDGDNAAKTWGKRVDYVGRGLTYAGLTYTTLKILAGAGQQQSQNQQAHKSAAMVLDWPAGRFLVGAAGLAVIGVGCWNLYRGLARKFEDAWRVGRLSHTMRTWGGRAGVLGHVARFVVFGLIGVFLVKAAIDYRPKDAIGLDGALQKLAHSSYGPALLGIVAAGLIGFALYCIADARYRRL